MDTTVNTHRNQMQWASGLNVLAGIWLFISAFTLHLQHPMMTNNVICAVIVVVLAAIRAFGAYDQVWISWLNVLVGLWVVISSWVVMSAPGAGGPGRDVIVNNCITGGLVIILGAWSAIATSTEPGPGGYPGTATASYGR